MINYSCSFDTMSRHELQKPASSKPYAASRARAGPGPCGCVCVCVYLNFNIVVTLCSFRPGAGNFIRTSEAQPPPPLPLQDPRGTAGRRVEKDRKREMMRQLIAALFGPSRQVGPCMALAQAHVDVCVRLLELELVVTL